jgi:hypothetical protein
MHRLVGCALLEEEEECPPRNVRPHVEHILLPAVLTLLREPCAVTIKEQAAFALSTLVSEREHLQLVAAESGVISLVAALLEETDRMQERYGVEFQHQWAELRQAYLLLIFDRGVECAATALCRVLVVRV